MLVSAGGGCGKTQAALECLRRFGGRCQDVLWVRASDGHSLPEGYRSIAGSLGRLASPDASAEDVQRAVKSWLAQHPEAWLAFDNLDRPDIARPTGPWPPRDRSCWPPARSSTCGSPREGSTS